MIKNELSTWMSKLKNVDHVGPFLVFYLPVSKLDKKSRSLVHNFFVENYNAYTHEISEINGYWVFKGELVEDKHERFEVSFKGIENFKKFIDFLSFLCAEIKEESIYLAFENQSWLIKPK
jgi:hypothetical protein